MEGKVFLFWFLLYENLKVGCIFNSVICEWRIDIIGEFFFWDVMNIYNEFISRRGGLDV